MLSICFVGENWRKEFYRFLDSFEGEDAETLRSIEMDVFHTKFKNHDSWEGTMEDNRNADKNVAKAVRSSLINYEKKMQGGN